MELFRAGVEHVFRFLSCRSIGICIRPALSGRVVDRDARLHIVTVDIEADSVPLVLDRPSLELHARGDQIAPLEHRRCAVQHMVAGLPDVIRHQVLKRQHALHVEIPRARDQVAFVGVFTGQLVADQVAAVVQVFAVNKVILDRLPAGRLDLPDRAALLCRHQVGGDAGVRRAAPAEQVERRVFLERGGSIIRFCEIRLVTVDLDIGRAAVSRHTLQRDRGLRLQHRAARQQQTEDKYDRRPSFFQCLHLQ